MICRRRSACVPFRRPNHPPPPAAQLLLSSQPSPRDPQRRSQTHPSTSTTRARYTPRTHTRTRDTPARARATSRPRPRRRRSPLSDIFRPPGTHGPPASQCAHVFESPASLRPALASEAAGSPLSRARSGKSCPAPWGAHPSPPFVAAPEKRRETTSISDRQSRAFPQPPGSSSLPSIPASVQPPFAPHTQSGPATWGWRAAEPQAMASMHSVASRTSTPPVLRFPPWLAAHPRSRPCSVPLRTHQSKVCANVQGRWAAQTPNGVTFLKPAA
ncbi:hypothetical protein BC628DRAFT_826815 [Trametes gibbosa]|nr:hypothetical protein BC628DRAFT_826815 [Trametes gibbosa]